MVDAISSSSSSSSTTTSISIGFIIWQVIKFTKLVVPLVILLPVSTLISTEINSEILLLLLLRWFILLLELLFLLWNKERQSLVASKPIIAFTCAPILNVLE